MGCRWPAPEPRTATIRRARAPAIPTPTGLDSDFRDDESTARSDDPTRARRRPHRPGRRLPSEHRGRAL